MVSPALVAVTVPTAVWFSATVKADEEVMIGGGVTVMAGITIGRRSFIAAGAVVTCDIPPESFVRGCPGRIEPLPEKLDVKMDRSLAIQSLDLWHPGMPDLGAVDWPSDWPEVW